MRNRVFKDLKPNYGKQMQP